jgi:hypothetical protein
MIRQWMCGYPIFRQIHVQSELVMLIVWLYCISFWKFDPHLTLLTTMLQGAPARKEKMFHTLWSN